MKEEGERGREGRDPISYANIHIFPFSFEILWGDYGMMIMNKKQKQKHKEMRR